IGNREHEAIKRMHAEHIAAPRHVCLVTRCRCHDRPPEAAEIPASCDDSKFPPASLVRKCAEDPLPAAGYAASRSITMSLSNASRLRFNSSLASVAGTASTACTLNV